MPSIALYYPWMHFQDDDWLKLALLTWDKVVRVRPRDIDDRDGELVRQVRDETDLLLEIVPSQADLEVVAENFFEVLDSNPDEIRAEIVERYHVERGDAASWASLVDFRVPASQSVYPLISNVGSAAADPELFWIYCGSGGTRISERLRGALIQTELAKQQADLPAWIAVQPKLGSIYMATLAEVVAQHNALSPVTDDVRIHHAAGALDRLGELLLDKDFRRSSVADPESAYLHLALGAVIEPAHLSTLPVSRLVKFRQRYQAELIAFREHVAGLAPELEKVAAIENPDVARAHLQAIYDTLTKRQLDELRRALRKLGVESTVGSLGLKVDLSTAPATVLGGVAIAGGSATLGAAAVALAVVPYVAGKLKARREHRTASPVAYLLAADRGLNGATLLPTRR